MSCKAFQDGPRVTGTLDPLIKRPDPEQTDESDPDKDPEKSKRVMNAMLKMDKIDIKALQEAYDREYANP